MFAHRRAAIFSWVVVALGLVLGVLASLVAWWLVARYLTPHLRISAVSKVEDVKGEGGWRYHVKVVNRTRHPVAEFSVDAVLVVPGLNPDIPDVEFRYLIPLAPGPVYPYLDAKECVIVGLRVNDLEGRLERLPDELRSRLATREVTLEELLALQPNASLRIAIRAAHYLSGNKRTYALRYTEVDIRPGVFRERLDVEIVPVGARSPGPRESDSTQ